MLDIKKYSNGKYFDAVNQKYLKKGRIKEYIRKGEQLQITLTTTGEDITDEILSQFKKSTQPICFSGFITSDLKRWISDTVDHRVKQVLDIMNLPTKDQMTQLNSDLKALDAKIQAWEAKWQKRAANAPSDCDDETSTALTVSEAKKKEAEEDPQNDGADASDAIGDSKGSDNDSLSKITFDDLLSDGSKTDDDKTKLHRNLSVDGAGDAATDDAVKSSTEPKITAKKATVKRPRKQKISTAKKSVTAVKKRTPTKRS